MKLWQKNYLLNKFVEDFTVGNDYLLDQKLLEYDCIASTAHAKMLFKIKILSKKELNQLIKSLNEIIALNKKGKFKIKKEQEDSHTAIENYLIKKLGTTGKKIHTGRSRNDQVLTALRLYSKNELKEIEKLSVHLINEISKFKKSNLETKMPGFTHMTKAMPSSVSLWSHSFIESFEDNLKLLKFTSELIDQNPLGTGAGYGVSLNLNRQFTAKLLGFKKVQLNPIYTHNSRGKFESLILNSLTQIMFDLNKISNDLILFSMPEFNYFELPKEICTGSSIMPQKKNPDVLEIIRANYHVVLANEFQIKSLVSNLISGYHRDFQLTKKPLMDSFEITKNSLNAMILVFQKLNVNKKSCESAMTEELFATQKTFDLVKKGVSFRDAYKKIAKEFY